MKIYQIHEYGGEYEHFYDYIVGSYLDREQAQEEMDRLIEQHAKRKKQEDECYECFRNHSESNKECYKRHDDIFGGCENYAFSTDNPSFVIEADEVVE